MRGRCKLIQEVRCSRCKRTSEVDVSQSKDPFQPIGKNWTCGETDCKYRANGAMKLTASGEALLRGNFGGCDCLEKWLAAGNEMRAGSIVPCDHVTTVKPPKYHNEATVVDGIRFASKKEANRYAELKLMEKAKEIEFLELQSRFELRVNAQLICVYVADFSYHRRRAGSEVTWEPVVEDAKGVRTPVFKLKKKLMKAVLGIEVVEV